MSTPKLTNEIVAAAIAGFEQQKRQIDTQIAELRAWLSGASTEPAAAPGQPIKRGRRKMSAATRKAMADGQRRRWAAAKGAATAPEAPAKLKRKLSTAGRKAIVAALKKRWAAKRAAE